MYTSNLVIKVASLCNLNCTYCYVYNMGDTSYKRQPKFMSQEVIESMLLRIKNNCIENNLKEFFIVFHGGEPLLAGIDFYINFVETQKKIIPDNILIEYSMQSNGTLLTREFADALKKLNIQIGISIDSSPKSNNNNRIYHNGKGSYNEIVKGFNIVRKTYGDEMANCLCVIDTTQEASKVYSHFKKLGAKSVHFLFQDFNYIQSTQEDVPKVGKWLSEMFEIWYNDNDKKKPNIRPLTDLIALIFGKTRGTEIFGSSINQTLIIETDGSIETVDTLKICGDGFTNTKFNVLSNDLNLIYKESNLARMYYNSHTNLCNTCQNCIIEPVCGGGYLGHRFSKTNLFDNPSIYCKEIIELICYIQNEVLNDMSKETILESGIEYLNFNDITKSFSNENN
ncbi:radical SAM protein [Flavobacterium sp. N1736]|uniref:radical SAM protein n=1 Tax=Flavobacterium sp. N1736 TaxID=2986823 RepID=UPI00222588ED|nr:radical SAM protein [Flavobacterium sp. N1736]